MKLLICIYKKTEQNARWFADDTYMYDEDARCGGAGGLGPGGQHWYDEPPYESDPEDFLMGASGGPVPTATIQNGR